MWSLHIFTFAHHQLLSAEHSKPINQHRRGVADQHLLFFTFEALILLAHPTVTCVCLSNHIVCVFVGHLKANLIVGASHT